jgi:hypothetical protein
MAFSRLISDNSLANLSPSSLRSSSEETILGSSIHVNLRMLLHPLRDILWYR